MIEVYKYLTRHSPDFMNDIFKLIENMYNLQNPRIFQVENYNWFKYVFDAIPYRADKKLWQ